MLTRVTESLAIGALMLPSLALLGLSVTVAVSTVLGAGLAWPVRDVTLPEAILLRDAGEMERLIRAGANVDEAALVHYGVAGERELMMLPIEAAVAAREPEILQFVMAHRPALDDALRLRLLCFAERIDARDYGDILKASPAASPPDCRDVVTPW